MKKFIALFCTAVMLTVCLCVPAFATDESGEWVILDMATGSPGSPFSYSGLGWRYQGENILGIEVGSVFRISNSYSSDVLTIEVGENGRLSALSADDNPHPFSIQFVSSGSSFNTYVSCKCGLCFEDEPLMIEKFVPAPQFTFFDSVTFGVDSSASWVSTFADTIMTTPLLLLAAILTLLGFGVGFFKRLRT